MSRKPLIAGNWKMNGKTADIGAYATGLRARLAAGEASVDVLVCPPFPYLSATVAAFADSGVLVGGQDCHAKVSGANTGDVAAAMLKDIGCSAVIVGHSERRADHGESDETVQAKALAAQQAGLVAVICVGEGLEERKAGKAEDVVSVQLKGSLPEGATAANTAIAYEPVWAIGSGLTPSVAEIAAMHARLRRELIGHMSDGAGVRILYGGSVKPANSGEILGIEDVDGVLVGGASLKAEDFAGIVENCP